ncbi:MAG: 4-alpha-glucanotransferase, partial [Oscillospiraceae bacterium]|nr:4-alpha-glucanotransferase [Oscillospiraceae bacterium]
MHQPGNLPAVGYRGFAPDHEHLVVPYTNIRGTREGPPAEALPRDEAGAEEAPEAFIRALFKCPCDTVIVPMQDILGLGTEARMNYPGSTGSN